MSAQKDNSPRLEVISETLPVSSSQERRRRPRLSLTSEQFRLSQLGKVFSVADLSLEGMALRVLDRNDFIAMPVAAEIEGILNLRGHKLPVKAKVKHLGVQIVGCQFSDLEPDTKRVLENFLNPEVMGRELRPIPSSDAGTLWYHGPSGTDVLLSRGADGQYHRITLYVLGSFIQWDGELGLSTGRTSGAGEAAGSRSESWGVVRFETLVMHPDAQPDPDKLSVAKALIMSSNFPQDLKKWCVRKLTCEEG